MHQKSLFDLGSPDQPPNFPTLAQAELAGEHGQATALEHAESEISDFADRAGRMILELLASGPKPGETLVEMCIEAGIKPTELRAFGPVFGRLSRKGLIEKVGHCPRRLGHGTSGGNIWQLR